MRVVAIIPAYNEEDIIVASLGYLIGLGINVYLIENWSTDSTFELAREFVDRGVLAIERFPRDGPPTYHNWKDMLRRIESLTTEIEADWFLLQSTDEIRVSPWRELNLKEAIEKVDCEGFNSIDHAVMTFHPVDNGFLPGSAFEAYFKHFEFSDHPAHFLEINSWRKVGQPVSLAESSIIDWAELARLGTSAS